MSYDSYRVSVKVLENGFEVEVPDMAEIAKKKAAAEKAKPPQLSPYVGDCTLSYAAKSVKEVLARVKESLEQLPEGEYDRAFTEASEDE